LPSSVLRLAHRLVGMVIEGAFKLQLSRRSLAYHSLRVRQHHRCLHLPLGNHPAGAQQVFLLLVRNPCEAVLLRKVDGPCFPLSQVPKSWDLEHPFAL